MPIYEKPVRLLMKDFVSQTGLVRGQAITRDQVVSWFRDNYPKIKDGTISAHLIQMSTNARSRFHYKANPNGEDDVFFQLDGSHFRLYEREHDPPPIYTKEQASSETTQPEEEMEEPGQGSEFAYERDLRDFLARHLSLIEPGLRLYEEEGITGVEFPAGGRLIDILAVDRNANYVVIDVKVSRGYDRVIGQLLRYIAWVEQNHAEPHQRVRGVIIAREVSGDLRLAASKLPDVALFEYELSVSLRRIA